VSAFDYIRKKKPKRSSGGLHASFQAWLRQPGRANCPLTRLDGDRCSKEGPTYNIEVEDDVLFFKNSTRLQWISASVANNFTAFTAYVLAHNKVCRSGRCQVNVHYKPQASFCHFCSLPLHFLGRLEHFREDFAAVQMAANVSKAANMSLREAPRMNYASQKTSDVYAVFKRLSCCAIRSLVRLFEEDFAMFNYGYKKFLR